MKKMNCVALAMLACCFAGCTLQKEWCGCRTTLPTLAEHYIKATALWVYPSQTESPWPWQMSPFYRRPSNQFPFRAMKYTAHAAVCDSSIEGKAELWSDDSLEIEVRLKEPAKVEKLYIMPIGKKRKEVAFSQRWPSENVVILSAHCPDALLAPVIMVKFSSGWLCMVEVGTEVKHPEEIIVLSF